DGESTLRSFHDYRWDLDKDFLGGLVLALGGHHALAMKASQADIIMHSRIFYFARISGLTVAYATYRAWLREQYLAGQQPRIWEQLLGSETGAGAAHEDPSAPDWMRAAPKGELYVERPSAANEDDEESDHVPYPEKFAAIIQAVQSGEPVEGIIQIPDVVARNPTTTPFGSMQRPRKPWEKDQPVADGTSEARGHGLEGALDQSFPEQEETAE
ncbi:hypothetical protein M406DRAFT_242511, partial [Cryphonectria parasitica EP155]